MEQTNRVVLFDTETNKTAIATMFNINEFWWSEGNGSCDCNREIVFGHDASDTGVCLGNKRYIAVDITGEITNVEKNRLLSLFNQDYDNKVVKKANDLYKKLFTRKGVSDD